MLMNKNNFWKKMFFLHLPRDLLTDVLIQKIQIWTVWGQFLQRCGCGDWFSFSPTFPLLCEQELSFAEII